MKLYALERPLKGQFYLGRVSFLITEIFNQLTRVVLNQLNQLGKNLFSDLRLPW